MANDFLDLAANGLERDAEGLHGFGRDTFALVNEAKQNVLSADVAMVEQSRFFLR